MFLKRKLLVETLIILGISIYAYLVNWYSGNIGVIPIDSFGFFDTGYSITKGHLPIRDFDFHWATSRLHGGGFFIFIWK